MFRETEPLLQQGRMPLASRLVRVDRASWSICSSRRGPGCQQLKSVEAHNLALEHTIGPETIELLRTLRAPLAPMVAACSGEEEESDGRY